MEAGTDSWRSSMCTTSKGRCVEAHYTFATLSAGRLQVLGRTKAAAVCALSYKRPPSPRGSLIEQASRVAVVTALAHFLRLASGSEVVVLGRRARTAPNDHARKADRAVRPTTAAPETAGRANSSSVKNEHNLLPPDISGLIQKKRHFPTHARSHLPPAASGGGALGCCRTKRLASRLWPALSFATSAVFYCGSESSRCIRRCRAFCSLVCFY
ncbi:hypothetical protein MRX96_023410 [Rhipicephalus microplus]